MALTIEMPPQMAEEARGYAVLEGMTLEDLFLKTMRDELKRYRERKAKKAVAVQRMDEVSPLVQSFCGIVSLPPDFNEKEFKATRLAEKSKLDFVADWGRFQVQEDELNLSRMNDSLREVDFG